MSIIKQPLLFVGTQGEKHLYALYDSGANLSCINPEHLQGLEVPIPLPRLRQMATAAENHFIEVTHRVVLDFYMDDVLLSGEFLVLPGLSEDVIIGADTMQRWRIKLDFEHDQALVDPKVARLQLK